MAFKNVESIKEASFYKMLKYTIIFAVFIIFTISLFGIFLTFLTIKDNEKDLANVLVESIETKHERLKQASRDIATLLKSDIDEKDKQGAIDFKINNEEEIGGVMILDKEGYVEVASKEYVSFLGYDLSNKDYFKSALESDGVIISEPFIDKINKKIAIAYANKFKDSKDNTKVSVVILSTKFLKTSDKLLSLNYFITSNKGEVIFNNIKDARQLVDNKIIESIKEKRFDTFLYKDKINGRYALATVRADSKNEVFVVVEHYIFDNRILIEGILIIIVLNIFIIFTFILVFSARASNVVTKYIDIIIKELNKIEEGSYDVTEPKIYPYKEINKFMIKFYDMTYRVNEREQELLMYNDELKSSNEEITKMLEKINESEKEKNEQYIEIMHTLLNLIEIKDEYTAGHSKYVTYYATSIGRKLKNEFHFDLNIEKLRVASILHDIGKIGISGVILNKPSELTDEESNIIKTHSIKGHKVLRNVKNLNEEAIMVKHHHERYDGRGYPEGIKGNNIPLGARIICIADAYDAMTSDRPYKKGIPSEIAIGELIKNRGTQFDPFIVDVFVDMLRNSEIKTLGIKKDNSEAKRYIKGKV